MRMTDEGTSLMLRCPPVSTITLRPKSRSCCIRGYTSRCSSGSPPVISTRSHSYASTRDTTSDTLIFVPSVNAYGVSHQEHLRSHAVRRTNTHGRPVWVDSPCIEWKISLIVSTFSLLYLGRAAGRPQTVEYGDAKGDVFLEAHLNNLPQRQKFSGAAPSGDRGARHQSGAADARLSRETH